MLSRAVVVATIGSFERLRRFRKADDIMFKLSNRVVTHSAHEADLVID